MSESRPNKKVLLRRAFDEANHAGACGNVEFTTDARGGRPGQVWDTPSQHYQKGANSCSHGTI